MFESIPFTSDPLDRAEAERRDANWVEARLSDPSSRFLALWKLQVPAVGETAAAIAWASVASLDHLTSSSPPYLLGLMDGSAHFAVDVSGVDEPVEALGLEGASFVDTRSLAARLSVPESGIVAHARSLVDWHARHGFCPNCGGPTDVRDAGSSRKCQVCNANHFPRTDPVVIMVPWRGDRCVLGHRRGGAAGAHSAIAGFVDQGETIEAAVRREVKEEIGLEVDEVRYVTSQPWPFPSSLMIGCFAHVTTESDKVDGFEIESARWFTRAEIRDAIANPSPDQGFVIPNPVAIAHHIVKAWSELESPES